MPIKGLINLAKSHPGTQATHIPVALRKAIQGINDEPVQQTEITARAAGGKPGARPSPPFTEDTRGHGTGFAASSIYTQAGGTQSPDCEVC